MIIQAKRKKGLTDVSPWGGHCCSTFKPTVRVVTEQRQHLCFKGEQAGQTKVNFDDVLCAQPKNGKFQLGPDQCIGLPILQASIGLNRYISISV